MNETTNPMAELMEAEVIEVKSSTTPKIIEEDGSVNTAIIPAEEKAQLMELTKSLKVNDINSVSNYGADLANAMQKNSSSFLATRRSSQSGEMGELINGLLGQLGYIKIDDFNDSSKLVKVLKKIPLVNKLVMTSEKLMDKYDSIEKNIDTIAAKLGVTRQTVMRDNNALQVLFENNIQYGKQVEKLIIAGKVKLDEINAKLAEMQAHPEQYETHEIQDVQEFVHHMEHKLHDMVTLRVIIKQSLPQIRTVQYNNLALANNAQTIITNTLPVWKNQLTLACALYDQKEAVAAQSKVSETTDLILRKNAELLHNNSIEVAKETERSIVNIETLKTVTEQFIQTVNDIKQIHEDGRNKAIEAEKVMFQLDKQLETSMTAAIGASTTPLLS